MAIIGPATNGAAQQSESLEGFELLRDLNQSYCYSTGLFRRPAILNANDLYTENVREEAAEHRVITRESSWA